MAVWCVVLGLGLASASVQHLRPVHKRVILGLAVLVLLYGLVLHEQLADHPWLASAQPLWAAAAPLLELPVTPSASIVRHEPFFSLGAPLAATLALCLGLVVGADRLLARRLLNVVAWAGAIYALYGIVAAVVAPTLILWQERQAYVGNVTATFVNRNTAATYFGSCAVIWLLLLAERARGHLPKGRLNWASVSRHLVLRRRTDLLVPAGAFFICVLALLMSGSRAGAVISLLAFILALVVFFRRDFTARRSTVLLLLGAAVVGLLVLQFLGGTVSSRFDTQGLSDGGRFAAYRSILRMIADHPWFGSGLGSFNGSFPAYRTTDITMFGIYDIAHSTPLELATDLGLPLAGAIAGCWVAILLLLVRGVRRRRRDVVIPLGALCVASIGLIHSTVDFSLQIPGYAIFACAVIGAGLGQSVSSRGAVPAPPAATS